MNDQELITRLRQTGRSTLSPDQVQRMRLALLTEFDRVTLAAPHRSKGQYITHQLLPRPMIIAALASIIVALGLGTSTIANAAKPGDLLFGWDQATERVRLALTIGQEDKAKYEAQVAEERLQEQLELEAQHSEHAQEAAERASTAITQAIQAVSKAQVHLEGKDGHGSESLTEVEVRLRELRDRHENSNRELNVEAETERGQTAVKVESPQGRWEWITTTTEREALVREISERTGLPASDVRVSLKLDAHQESDDQGESTHANTNQTTNSRSTPDSSNHNTNETDDDRTDDSRNTNSVTNSAPTNSSTSGDDRQSEDAQSTIRVRVDREDGTTEIRTVVNGREQEWELSTVLTADILASITSRTGLPTAAITSTWDFAQK